jgi:hypothetical protein
VLKGDVALFEKKELKQEIAEGMRQIREQRDYSGLRAVIDPLMCGCMPLEGR